MSKQTIRQNIEYLLASNEDLRNDDKELIWTYWRDAEGKTEVKQFGGVERDDVYSEEIISLPNFKTASSPAVIIRIRALIQKDGMYLPTDEKIRKARWISEEKWLEYLGRTKTKENKNQYKLGLRG